MNRIVFLGHLYDCRSMLVNFLQQAVVVVVSHERVAADSHRGVRHEA